MLLNIDEIAKLSGVSRTTVSRYLNGGYVGQEKKEKIKQVIEKTGYRPSSYAQTLRTNRTRQVGVILPKISSDSISEMVEGISSVLTKAGYFMLLANTANDENAELSYLDLFSRNKVDGIILIGTILTPAHKKAFEALSVPIVVAAQQAENTSCVYYDDYGAAKAVTELLLQKSKCPAYIGVREDDKAAGLERKRGFRAALSENGLIYRESYCTTASFNMQSGYERAEELFNHHKEIDALFCATDRIAAGAMLYLKQSGRRIPEDVKVAGVGDGKLCLLTTPTLTSAHLYYYECGSKSAEILLRHLSGDKIVQQIRLGFTVEKRQSTE